MTAFLAVYSAVLATVLGLLEAARFYFDRPQLRVAPRLTIGVAGAWLMVDVVNRGRRPTTITEAGFESVAYHSVTLPDGREVPVRRWLKLDGPPTVLASGEMARYTWDVARQGFPPLVHADFPLRVYARDLNGKYLWGAASPMLRHVLNSAWQPPNPPEPLMAEPLPEAPLKPTPVYPRWKVWHPLGVRDPLPFERRLRRVRARPWEGGQPETPSEIVTVWVDEPGARRL